MHDPALAAALARFLGAERAYSVADFGCGLGLYVRDLRRQANFRQNVARFRLYRHRFLQLNMRFAAFLKIYQIIQLEILKFGKILQILQHLQKCS